MSIGLAADALTGRAAVSSLGPPTTLTDAAGLFDCGQISAAQAVVLHRVFAGGPQAMLRDASAHLIALTK